MGTIIDKAITRARAYAVLAGVVAVLATLMVGTASGDSGGVGLVTESASAPSASASSVTDGNRYKRMWRETSRKDRRWAKKTSDCESGGNPKAVSSGGTYRGAFQFMKDTWRSAPKSPGGDPIRYPYSTQAVVAVALMHREGTSPWPVCG